MYVVIIDEKEAINLKDKEGPVGELQKWKEENYLNHNLKNKRT